MTHAIDVLTAFNIGSPIPRPIRFRIEEGGEKKTVEVSEILSTADLGAGGMQRIEYTCRSAGANGPIRYKLKYYYQKGSWEIEI